MLATGSCQYYRATYRLYGRVRARGKAVDRVDKVLDIPMAKLMANVIVVAFFAIHVVMIVMFSAFGVMPMVYVNVFSLAFYVFSLTLVNKGYLRLFSILTYIEVVCHMTLAVFFTGWENGFQITLIGLSALVFFAEYIGHSLRIRHVRALPLCVIGTVAYLGVFVVSSFYPAPYSLSPQVSFWLQIAWGAIVFVISVAVLQAFITLTFNSEAALTTQIEHDRLTDLPNRVHMARYLNAVSDEEGLPGHWIAMADIDDFKAFNDTYGHNCGDFVLKELADTLRQNVGDAEICRWGGEEFLLAGSLEGDQDDLRAKLDRLRQAVAGHSFWYDEQKMGMTITIGAALYQEGETVHEWINRADEKLYEGKSSGKNCVVL